MRQKLPVLILALLVTTWARPVSSQQSTFSVSVDLIKVPISVFDEQGIMISDLNCADFRLYEDDAKQQIRSCGLDMAPVSVVPYIENRVVLNVVSNCLANSWVQGAPA